MPGLSDGDVSLHANFITLELLAVGLVVWDWRRGVRRSPFLVIVALLAFNHGHWAFAADIPGWQAFSAWFHGLPALGFFGS